MIALGITALLVIFLTAFAFQVNSIICNVSNTDFADKNWLHPLPRGSGLRPLCLRPFWPRRCHSSTAWGEHSDSASCLLCHRGPHILRLSHLWHSGRTDNCDIVLIKTLRFFGILGLTIYHIYFQKLSLCCCCVQISVIYRPSLCRTQNIGELLLSFFLSRSIWLTHKISKLAVQPFRS